MENKDKHCQLYNQHFTDGWTLKTIYAYFTKVIRDLRDYLDKRFNDNDKAVQAALVSQEKAVGAALSTAKEAVTKAEAATEKRFESVNEFRAQLADQTATLMPRAEYVVQHQALADKFEVSAIAINNRIDALSKTLDDKIDYNNKSIADLRSRLDVGNPAVTTLQNQFSTQKGYETGQEVTKAELYRAISLAVGIASIVIIFIAYFIIKK
jgi:hypothetical protein